MQQLARLKRLKIMRLISTIKAWFIPEEVPAYVIESKHNIAPESAFSASGQIIYKGDESADAEVSRVIRVYGLKARKRLATEEEKQTAKVWL
jgi:hypothetical protein